MNKHILIEDIPRIKHLLSTALQQEGFTAISRMGGLTNRTYKVTIAKDEEYVVRIPGEGTEEMIIRSDELISTKLACSLDIDAELLYFGKNGEKITRYIKNANTMSSEQLRQNTYIMQMAEIFQKLHSCEIDTCVPFNVFDLAADYEKIIYTNGIPMFDDYSVQKSQVMQIKQEIDSTVKIARVPCHNDPLCENWVEGNGRLYLIDWEYAGMNDGMWDIADTSIEASFDENDDLKFLTAYLGHEPSITEKKHFLANKIYVDFLWTLWAKTRVPYDGQPMEDWAIERYTRLKGFIAEYCSHS